MKHRSRREFIATTGLATGASLVGCTSRYQSLHGVNPLTGDSTKLVADPITWVTVGQWAAQGIVGWIGAELFSKLFTNGQQVDWSELIEKLVREMDVLIKRNIKANELRKLSADLDHVQRMMRMYNNNRQDLHLLVDSTRDISRSFSHLKTFDLVGHQGFLMASIEYVSVLQERISRYGNAERKNLKNALTEIETHLTKIHGKYPKWSDSSCLISELRIPRTILSLTTDSTQFSQKLQVLIRTLKSDSNCSNVSLQIVHVCETRISQKFHLLHRQHNVRICQ